MSQKNWIDNNPIIIDFEKHLQLNNNNRVILSSPFGTGKSTFLNEFFDAKKEAFNVITLNPVNYSVASNEDIFELIKFDVMTQLLENYQAQLSLEKTDFSILWIMQSFAKTKLDLYRLTKSFLKAFVPEGDVITDLAEALEQVNNDFKAYKDDINRSEETQFKAYLKQFEKTKGSIYEKDEMTLLINGFLTKIKDASHQKEIVLLIDDLDRLDPEHLFRIFNIFSAHYHNNYDKNKFGFDKIIFVCDIRNVHQIFSNRYGQDVDFSGYIDKFYSIEVFEFDNKKFINELIYFIAKDKVATEPVKWERIYNIDRSSNSFFSVFEYVIRAMVEKKLLSLRSIQHLHTFGPATGVIKSLSSRGSHKALVFKFLGLVYNLKQLFPSIDSLLENLTILSKTFNKNHLAGYYHSKDDFEDIEKAIIDYCLPFIADETIIFGPRNGNDRLERTLAYRSYESSDLYHLNTWIDYSRDEGVNVASLKDITGANGGIVENFNVFDMMCSALNNCIKNDWV